MARHRRLLLRLEGCAAATCLFLIFNLFQMTSIWTTTSTVIPCEKGNNGDYQHQAGPLFHNMVANDGSLNILTTTGGQRQFRSRIEGETDGILDGSNIRGRQHQYGSGGVRASQRSNRPLLPDRLITVTGLESSGTTFVATTLAKALSGGTRPSFQQNTAKISHPGSLTPHTTNSINNFKNDTFLPSTTWIQHISLPTGYYAKHHVGFERRFELPATVDVMVPEECAMPQRKELTKAVPAEDDDSSHYPKDNPSPRRRLPRTRPAPRECQDNLGIATLMEYPHRFFVNITSHARWYQEHGVPVVTVVIVVRDTSMHFPGILKLHCPNATAAQLQFEHGRLLVQETLTMLQGQQQQQSPTHPPIHLVMVSYETLMSMQGIYLMDIYHQLGIDSTFVPQFVDGNAKYFNRTTTITA